MSKTFIDIVGRDLTGGAFDSAGRRLNVLSGSVNALKGSLGALGVGFSAVASLSKVITSASQFENSLIGVAKTTGLTGRELESFADRVDSLSKTIPVTTEELLNLAQAAGQMGVTGADNLEKFSVTVAKLGRASDLAGEDAAKSLARILNVTGESVDSVDTLASVFVSLGNNVAASESEIARITTEVARASGVFGVTSAEAAAMGAAMSAVGIRAELGGSSVGRAMQEITSRVQAGGSSLRQFATALELNEETLVSLFAENKTKAFEFFLKNVGELGLGAGNALESVGLGGQEIAKTIIPLANNMGIFAETLALANDEVEDATALNAEFEASLSTLSSEWQITKNIMESFARSIGESLLPALNSGLEGLNSFFAGASAASEVEKQINLISSLEEELRHLEGLSGVFGVFGPTKKDFDLLESQLENAKLDLIELTKSAEESSVALNDLADNLNLDKPSASTGGSSSTRKAISESQRFINALKKEAAEAGKTGLALQRYRAEVLGVSKVAKPLIDHIAKTNKELKDQQTAARKTADDLAKIESITASVATKQEKYNETLKELERLKPYLGVETYTRALQQAQEELRGVETASRGFFQNTEQFGIQAARNIQTAFASFLSGTEADFGRMIKNMVGQLASRTLLTGFESAIKGGLALLTQSDATPSREASELLDLNRSSLKTNERILQSSDETASALDKIIKGAQLGSLNGEEDALTRTAFNASQSLQNPNVLAGSAAVAGGRVLGTSDTATAIAGGLATFGGPIGIGAGAAVLAIDFLDKKFGDFKLGETGKRIQTEIDIVTLGAAFTTRKFSEAIGLPDITSTILKALIGRGPLKQKETTFTGQLGADGLLDALINTKFKAKGSLLKSSKKDFTAVDLQGNITTDNDKLLPFAEDLAKHARQVFGEINDGVTDASKLLLDAGDNLGLSTAGVRNFNREIELVSEKGKFFTEEQISQEIGLIADELSTNLIPEIEAMADTGESLFQTIHELNFEFDILKNALQVLGSTSAEAKAEILGLSFEQRSELVKRAGGEEELNRQVGVFFDLLPDQRKLEILTDDLLVKLQDMGATTIPALEDFMTVMQSGLLSLDEHYKGLEIAGDVAAIDALSQSLNQSGAGLSKVNDAFSSLRDSVDAERNRLSEEYNASIAENAQLISETASSISKLGTLSKALGVTINNINPIGLTQARGALSAAIESARSGNVIELDSVRNALTRLSDNDTSGFGSRIDFLRSQAENVSLLRELGGITDTQLSTEESSLKALEEAKDLLDSGFDDEISRLDDIITGAQSQLDALNGIDNTLLSISAALGVFDSAANDAGSLTDTSRREGSFTDIFGAPALSGLSGSVINDYVESNLDNPIAIYNAARANNVSGSELAANSRFTLDQVRAFELENNLTPLATGTNFLPEDMPFFGHKGEEVKPKAFVDRDRAHNEALAKKVDKLIGLFEKVVASSEHSAQILENVAGEGVMLTEAA